MREMLRKISATWRGRMFTAVGLALLVVTLILAYKAGQMRLLG